MADSIFDLQDNLSQPGMSGFDTFQQRLAAQRALLEQTRPDIAAQMPTLGANTPGQQGFQAAQQQPVQDLGQTVSQVSQAVAQGATPEGAKPKEAMASQQGIEQILDYLNPLKPKQTYGPNVGKSLGMGDNAGGILGLGVQPIDVLAFALGAAVTRNMPQDKAIATTMHLAGLPKAFRDSQEANARKFIDDQINAVNGMTAQGNLAQRQMENAVKLQALMDQQNFIGGLTKRLQSGVPLSETEKQVAAIQAKRAGIDPNVIKDLLIKRDIPSQLADLQTLSEYAKNNNLGTVRGTVQLPGGGSASIGAGGSSGRALVTGELSDALATGQNTDKLLAAGFDVSTPEGRAKVQAALNTRKEMEANRLQLSERNTDLRQRSLEQLKPEESKKLESFVELHRSASDMLNKYEASLQSHGGKFTPSLQAAIQGATRSPDGYIGATVQALAQRHPDLTEADRDFISRYASMQKFARGMLNDVGNLSNYERGLVTNIIGTPLDVPAQFRSRTKTAINDVATTYDQARRALPARDVSMFPERLGAPAKQQQQEQPQNLSKQGMEFLQELKKAMGK